MRNFGVAARSTQTPSESGQMGGPLSSADQRPNHHHIQDIQSFSLSCCLF